MVAPVVKTRTFTGTCKKGHKVVVARKVGDRWEQVPCGECGALSSHPRGKPSGERAQPTGGTRDGGAALQPGLAKEVQLAEALNAAGLHGWESQYPWGLMLKPARKYVADFYYPKERVIVESVGRAHAAGVEKVYKDAERSALAASLGILVVPLHPGMINDGTGVELVRAALGAREGA